MMGKNFGQARFEMLFQDLREDMKDLLLYSYIRQKEVRRNI